MAASMETPFVADSPRRSRAISFKHDLAALDIADLDSDSECCGPASKSTTSPNRKLSHTGSMQVRSPVNNMRARTFNWEAHNSRVDAPSHLWTTINPQYTIVKARELYGGAPRPLSARHEFIKQAFLSDTEDWRSSAYIGTRTSHVATMDIVNPENSTYLRDAAKKHMSFSREMSLKRSVSHRAVLVKKDGTLAETQYTDQYLDKDRVRSELKKQMSRVSFGGAPVEEEAAGDKSAFMRSLSKSLSRVPARSFASSLSRAASRRGSAAGSECGSPSSFGGEKIASPVDRGMGRAISRVMSRARAASLSPTAASRPQSASIMMQPPISDDEELEEAPRMEDL